MNEGGGNFEAPLSILSETRLRTSSISIASIARRTGGSYTQLNSQGRECRQPGRFNCPDEEKLEVFLAGRTPGRHFPLTPDFLLDIAAIEENIGQFDIDNLDFST